MASNQKAFLITFIYLAFLCTASSSTCIDHNDLCNNWKSFCDSNHYTKSNCPLTCGLCPKVKIAKGGQLTCNETGMIVKFNKTELDGSGREYNLMFKGESEYPCKVNSSTTSNIDGSYIWIKADYNECGIDVYENDGRIIYNQTIMVWYGENPSTSVIFHVGHDEYHLECYKMSNVTASMDIFNVSMDRKTFYKVGQASFEVDLFRYQDGTFVTTDTSGRASLGDDLFFKLSLKTAEANLTIYPQDCYAIDKTGSLKYMIIENRCANPTDSTHQTMESRRKYFAWKMKSFRFFGNSDEISISCYVLICLDISTNPKCNFCQSGNRKRRDLSSFAEGFDNTLVGESKALSLQTGWIFLVDEDKKKSSPQIESNVFSGANEAIIIVLLASFIFILTGAVIKTFFFSPIVTADQSQTIEYIGM